MIETTTFGPGSEGMKRRAYGYLRVSTDRQAAEDRTSLADQRAAIERLAVQVGAVVVRWFEDRGISGATAERRPDFMALVAACAADPQPRSLPGFVFALNASRWGRFDDPEEAAYWRHLVRKNGWAVRFAEGDAEGDAAPIVRAVTSLEASTYRRQLVANTRRGMQGAARLGFWTREAPYGFRREVVLPAAARRVLERGELKTPAEKVRLIPHPEEADIVRWVYETYATGGASLGTIAAELRRRAPGRRWGRTVLAHLVRNDVYRGAVVGGRRRDGEGAVYGCEGAHEALVPAALWQAAQRRLAANAKLGPAVRTDYLLTGLLACPYCGQTYAGGGGGRKSTRTHTCRRFYRDSGGIAGVCPGRIGTVMRHLVDDAAVEMIASTVRRPAYRRLIERGVDTALAAGPRGSAAALRGARARHEQRRERLVAALADGTLLPEEAAEQLERARAGIAETDGQLQALRFARRRAEGARSERDRVLQLVVDLPALLERASQTERRELLEPWLGSAAFDKVTRRLSIGLRTAPAVPSIVPFGRPAPVERPEVGLIVRSTSLLQHGHEHRVATAAARVRRGRTA